MPDLSKNECSIRSVSKYDLPAAERAFSLEQPCQKTTTRAKLNSLQRLNISPPLTRLASIHCPMKPSRSNSIMSRDSNPV